MEGGLNFETQTGIEMNREIFTKEDGEELVRIGREMIEHASRDNAEAESGAGTEVLFDQFDRMANYVAEWLPYYLKFLKANKPADVKDGSLTSRAYMGSIQTIGPHIEALATMAVELQYHSDNGQKS